MKKIFYTDVKVPIIAGMQFCYTNGQTNNNKLAQIGYKIIRLYYDKQEKDYLINEKCISKIITANI